jgi:hypothetical protein
MNISNYYWYFQSAIPPRICDMIVQYGKAEKEREVWLSQVVLVEIEI